MNPVDIKCFDLTQKYHQVFKFFFYFQATSNHDSRAFQGIRSARKIVHVVTFQHGTVLFAKLPGIYGRQSRLLPNLTRHVSEPPSTALDAFILHSNTFKLFIASLLRHVRSLSLSPGISRRKYS